MALLWLMLKWYTILEDLFLVDSVRYHDDVMTTLKVWLVQYRDPDVRLISQIDSVMCFIYNISAMSWRYWGWCHSDIVTISECPLDNVAEHTNIPKFSKLDDIGTRLILFQSFFDDASGDINVVEQTNIRKFSRLDKKDPSRTFWIILWRCIT